MRVRVGILSVAVVCAALVVSSCGGDSSSTPKPQRGGDLTMLHYEPVATTLNRLTEVLLGSIWPIQQIEENLTFVDGDGKAQPLLARSWDTSDDGLTWTFDLRDNVKFSDGTPMTADDVAFSLLQTKRPDAIYRYLFDTIESVEASDPTTAVVKLSRPDPYLPLALSNYNATIIPKDFGGKSEKEFTEQPIGTGPFMLESPSDLTKGSSVRLVRNPGYWRKGRPYLDSVTVKYIPDENQRILQLKGGQAQIASFVAPDRATVALEESTSPQVKNLPAFNQLYLIMGQKFEPLTDEHVRRAIVHAIDREALLKAAVVGRGEPGTTFLNNRLPGYDGSVGLPFDLEAAKAEMAESNYPNGFEVVLLTSSGQETLNQLLQSQLKAIGIDVKLRSIDEGARFEAELALDYELAVQPYGMVSGSPNELVGAVLDPDVLLSMFTGFDDPDLAAQGREAVSEVDEEKRNQLLSDVQGAQAQAAFAVALYYLPQPFAFTDNVQGFKFGAGFNVVLSDTSLAP